MEIPLARGYQNPLAAQRARRLDVRQAIPHPPRVLEVDPQRRLRVEEQLGAGFAAGARLRGLRMVRTEERLIGPLISSATAAAVGTGDVFSKGRDFAA